MSRLLACWVVVASGFAARVASADDGPSAEALARARRQVEHALVRGVQAPEFAPGLSWLNVSRPLSLKRDLRGKVVVLDFWCYCCVNCMHVLPDLAWLERRWAGKAVAIVGVHSAKFTTEKDADAVRQAVVRYEITHPVVVDSDFSVFQAFQARGWPHFVVIGPGGDLIDAFGGEGHREEIDALISATLEVTSKPDATPLPLRREAASLPAGELSYPGKVAVDAATKRLWIADTGHHRVVETDLEGRFVRAFGDGEPGFSDGPAGTARFHRPQGLLPLQGALYVADAENHAVRRVRLDSGVVETVAGTGRQGYESAGRFPARSVDLSTPWDLCAAGGSIYVACAGNHQIWRLDLAAGTIEAWAGNSHEARRDGPTLSETSFAQPSGLTTDGRFLYVVDSESSSIRRIALPAGPVTTLAGGSPDPTDLFSFGLKDGTGFGAKFQHPLGVLFANGALHVADTYDHAIRVVDPATGATTTPYGTGRTGASDEGRGEFAEPSGLATDGVRIFVADTDNHRIRVITPKQGLSTLRLAGVPLPMTAARAAGTPSSWPAPSDGAAKTLPAAPVPAGKPLAVDVRLSLPEGRHLTEGASSVVRIEGVGDPVEEKLTDLATTVSLGAVPAAGGTLRVRLLYYVCQDAGTCRVRSAELLVPLTLDPAAPARLSLTDSFPP